MAKTTVKKAPVAKEKLPAKQPVHVEEVEELPYEIVEVEKTKAQYFVGITNSKRCHSACAIGGAINLIEREDNVILAFSRLIKDHTDGNADYYTLVLDIAE